MRQIYTCQCGKEVTMNTWKTHLKSKKCNADLAIKEEIISILELKLSIITVGLRKKKSPQ
jgi:hypothetical protein